MKDEIENTIKKKTRYDAPKKIKITNFDNLKKNIINRTNFYDFNKVKIDDILKLSENKKYKFYKKYQVIFSEHTKPLGVYYLKEGRVKIFKTDYKGKEQIIRFASPGDLLGIKAIIAEKNHITSATALEDSIVCLIPGKDFLKLIKENTDLTYSLIKILCELQKETDNRIISAINRSERERLAEALLILSKKFNSENINILKKDLANFSIIESDKLKHYLYELKEKKLISINSQRIKILDETGLKKLAKF